MKYLVTAIIGILLTSILLVANFYYGSINTSLHAFTGMIFNLPVGNIGESTISYKEFNQNIQIVSAFNDELQLSDKDLYERVWAKLLRDTKLSHLIESYQITFIGRLKKLTIETTLTLLKRPMSARWVDPKWRKLTFWREEE